ncbi:C-X-C motif chemokine 2-like isoform X2 [Sylvia atricapilla]|uniref:C-X-C motif chemokine 2-like isoform X2 n=1 Tax=Sylvia atricapilla TaxID=48155 RepID=UPI0033946472
MRLLPVVLTLLLLLSSSVPGGGLSLESLLTNMRCKCIKSTTHIINLGLILTIDVTPPGIHCRRKEVILTLKKNRRVCVTPEAPWIQLLIHKLMQKSGTKKVLPRPRREAPCCWTHWGPPTLSLPLPGSKESTVMNSLRDSNDTTPLP